MRFKAKNNIIFSILYIVLGFVTSMATTFAILWPYYHGVTSGNRGVDLYIFICVVPLVFYTVFGILRYIFTKNSGVDVPYLIYMWIIYITVCGIGILLVKSGAPIPEKEKTLYVMIGASFVLGIAAYIVTGLIENKKGNKLYDKLKKEIEDRKQEGI